MSLAIATGAPATGTRIYDVPVLYNQGSTPHCVGYAWAAFMSAVELIDLKAPITFDADGIYEYAHAHDDIKESHDGTTVRAGAKALAVGAKALDAKSVKGEPKSQSNKLDKYLWATSIDDVVRYVLNVSPVVIGIDWYASMMRPTSRGQLFVNAHSGLKGGHAVLVRGINTVGGWALIRNSWGKWGIGGTGDCKIALGDLAKLLDSDGEACAAIDHRDLT